MSTHGGLITSVVYNQSTLNNNRTQSQSQSTNDKVLTMSNHSDRKTMHQQQQHTLGHKLPFAMRLSLARDAAAGVAFLHSKGLIHCDIKSLNFLITKDLVIKLSDLGESREVSHILDGNNNTSIPRNINWSSPEVLEGSNNITQSSDVWSLAFVISEIFTGNVPFDTFECRNMPFDVFKENLRSGMRPTIPPSIYVDNPWFQTMVSRFRKSIVVIISTVIYFIDDLSMGL